MRYRLLVLRLAALGALGVVAFLALRSSPWLGELSWMPRWLSDWADRNGDLRNLPAFAGLAAVLVLGLGRRWGGIVAATSAVGLEAAQVFIAGRVFGWADIAWSLVGVALVLGPLALLANIRGPSPGQKSRAEKY